MKRRIACLGMVQDRLCPLDYLFALPAVGLKDVVEGCALHTSWRRIKRNWNLSLGAIGNHLYWQLAIASCIRTGA